MCPLLKLSGSSGCVPPVRALLGLHNRGVRATSAKLQHHSLPRIQYCHRIILDFFSGIWHPIYGIEKTFA